MKFTIKSEKPAEASTGCVILGVFEEHKLSEVAMGTVLAVRSDVVEQMQGFDPHFFHVFRRGQSMSAHSRCRLWAGLFVSAHGLSCRRCKRQARMILVIRQSMFKYFRKHEPTWKIWLFTAVFKPLFLLHMITTWLKQLLRAGLARIQPDSRDRREKYQRRLDVTREFLVKYSVEFLRA